MKCETKMHAYNCLDGMNKPRSRQKAQLGLMRTAQMLMKSKIVNRKSQIPRAFTLIELLVVIAIIAI